MQIGKSKYTYSVLLVPVVCVTADASCIFCAGRQSHGCIGIGSSLRRCGHLLEARRSLCCRLAAYLRLQVSRQELPLSVAHRGRLTIQRNVRGCTYCKFCANADYHSTVQACSFIVKAAVEGIVRFERSLVLEHRRLCRVITNKRADALCIPVVRKNLHRWS